MYFTLLYLKWYTDVSSAYFLQRSRRLQANQPANNTDFNENISFKDFRILTLSRVHINASAWLFLSSTHINMYMCLQRYFTVGDNFNYSLRHGLWRICYAETLTNLLAADKMPFFNNRQQWPQPKIVNKLLMPTLLMYFWGEVSKYHSKNYT